MEEAKTVGKPGRPRDEVVHAAILVAAFELLVERGYAAMSIDAVASRAGVGRTTIYRRWSHRADLAVEAFFAGTEAALVFPETGSTREDFRRQIHQVGAVLRGSSGAAMAAMIAGSLTEPTLARALGERWVGPRMRWGQARLLRARDENETRPGIDLTAALAALYAPLYTRLCFGLPAMKTEEIEAHLAIVLSGIYRSPP